MAPSAVVFDLDETLAEPRRDRESLLAAATTAVGARSITRDEYVDAHLTSDLDQTRRPIFEKLIDDRETAHELADAYCDVLTDAFAPLDGAPSLLETLATDGYRLGVLTDGPVRAQRRKIETLGWDDHFEAVVVTGALPTRKPDPAVFEAALAELDVSTDDAVYIGDSPRADVAGAVEIGLDVIQVTFDGGPDPDPRADVVIDRSSLFEELPGLLDSM